MKNKERDAIEEYIKENSKMMCDTCIYEDNDEEKAPCKGCWEIVGCAGWQPYKFVKIIPALLKDNKEQAKEIKRLREDLIATSEILFTNTNAHAEKAKKVERLRDAIEKMRCYGQYCDSFGMTFGGFSLGDKIDIALKGVSK